MIESVPSTFQESTRTDEAFQVGEFRVEPLRNSLLHGAETLHLRPTAMAVLILLSTHPRKVLTKEEFLGAVWEDRFVSEGVLHNAITELRQALGDDPKEPWAIETIHGTGYRLIAPVVRDLPPSGFYPMAARRSGRSWIPAALATAGVALAIVAVTATLSGRRQRPDGAGLSLASCQGSFLCQDTSSDEAYRLYHRGLDLAAAQEGDEAIRILEEALAKDRRFIYACDLLANLYDTKHLKEIAREKIAACRQPAEKGEFFRWLLRRREAQIDERWQEELEALGQLARLDPKNPEWHHRLGFFYLTHDRDCDRGLEQHLQAADGEASLRNLTYLAEAQLQCGQEGEALETLDRASLEDRRSKSWRILRSLALRRSGRTAEAERLLVDALEGYPEDPWLLLALGDLKLADGAPAEALRFFRSARSKSIDDGDYNAALLGQGGALLELGRGQEARKVAIETQKRSTAGLQAYWLDGVTLVALGDLEGAEQITKQAAQRLAASQSRFEEEWVRHLQGTLALARGDAAEAVKRFQEALEAQPLDRPFFVNALAQAQVASQPP